MSSLIQSSGLTSFAVPNARITASIASNNLTLKMVRSDGTDPSPTSPLFAAIPDAANGTANAFQITAPPTIVLNNGSSLAAGTPFRFWLLLFEDMQMGVAYLTSIGNNSLTTLSLDEYGVASSTAEGGGSAVLSGTIYTTSAVSNKNYRLIGFVDYDNGLSVYGRYDALPTRTPMFSAGGKKPGDIVKTSAQMLETVGTTTSVMSIATGFTSADGRLYNQVAITPTSPVNLLKIRLSIGGAINTAGLHFVAAIFKHGDTNFKRAAAVYLKDSDVLGQVLVDYMMRAGTTSSITFDSRVGPSAAGTLTVCGINNGAVFSGNTQSNILEVTEIMS